MSHVTDNAAFTEFMTYSKKRLLVLCSALMMPSLGTLANGNDYEEQRVQAVQNCAVIDPREHQSGLFFNPDGYRSYYKKSQCFQSAAITFRDIGLCEKVRQRRALFSSSWGYSETNCVKLVEKAIADDNHVRISIQMIRRIAFHQLYTLGLQLRTHGRIDIHIGTTDPVPGLPGK